MLPLHQGGSGAPSLPHGPDAGVRWAASWPAALVARGRRWHPRPVTTRRPGLLGPLLVGALAAAVGRVGRAGPRDLAGRGRVDHRGAAGLAGVRGADRARRRRARALLRAAAPLVRRGRASRRCRSACPPWSRSASAPRCSPCSAPGSRGAGPGSRPGSSRRVLPTLVWAGGEGRSYAWTATLATGTTLALLHALAPHASRGRAAGAWIGYAALLALGTVLFVDAVLLAVAHLVAALLIGRGRRRIAAVLAIVAACVCAGPLIVGGVAAGRTARVDLPVRRRRPAGSCLRSSGSGATRSRSARRRCSRSGWSWRSSGGSCRGGRSRSRCRGRCCRRWS